MVDSSFSVEDQVFFKESLSGHPIGTFMSKCGNSCGCPWTVDYRCGCCCKRACNAKIVGICGGLLYLEPFDCYPIAVKTFGEEGVIDTICARFVLIPWENVCSIEIGVAAAPAAAEAE